MNWDEYTRRFGKHSNIPECCIEAFIKGETVLENSLDYARCQTCKNAGVKAEIHFCTPDCAPFLQSIGKELCQPSIDVTARVGGY